MEGWGLSQRRIGELLGMRLHFHRSNFSCLIKPALHAEETSGSAGLHNTRGYLVHPRMIIIYPVPKNPHRKRFCTCWKGFKLLRALLQLTRDRKKEKFCTSSTEKQERSVLEGLLLILYFFI